MIGNQPSSGGSGSGYTIVATYADLPDPAVFANKIYVVTTATGLWPFNRKPAGMYNSDGAAWTYMGVYPDLVKDSNFGINNDADPTKVVKFSNAELESGTTATIFSPVTDIHLEQIKNDIAEAKLALIEHAGTGLNNPTNAALIIQTSAITLTVLPESGYISDNVGSRKRIEWTQFDNVVLAGAGINYVRIDSNGDLDVTTVFSGTVDDYIEIGYVFGFDIGGGVIAITNVLNTPKYNGRFTSRVNDFWTLVLKALVVEGTGVSALLSPAFGLSIAPGQCFINGVLRDIGNNVNTTTFTKYFNTADLGWLPLLTDPNVLNPNIWNDITQPAATALQPMPAGYWKQDVVFRTGDGSCFVICGQAPYATEALADKAPLALAPAQLTNVAVYLAKINIQQGSTGIESECVYDIRPYWPRVFGFGSASAGSVISHNSLADLTIGDPHIQYLLKSVAELTYAALGDGVTGGNAHDHTGGHGAQISYTSLSNLPTLGTAAAKNIPATGNASVTEVVYGTDTRLADARTPVDHASTHVTGGGDVIANAVAGVSAGFMSGDDKTKLDGIAAGAEVNVNADWNAATGDAEIKNKPTLGTAAAKNIPASGNASVTEVVYGTDTRLADARTPATHGNEKHSAAYIVQADAVIPNAAITPATGTKITVDAKGLSTGVTNATTADISDSTDKRYCTDAQKTVISNTSNTNTGDETTATIKTKLGITTLSGSNTGDETATSIKTALGITTLSGSNTGDETATSIKTALGITTLSGSNTGDQTLSGLGGVPTARTVNGHALTADVTVSASDVGLGNVTNESKATMFTNPTFTGTPTGIAESVIAFTDILTNDVSTTKHGYTPKLPGNTTSFLRGDGTWAVPTVVAAPGGSTTQVQYNNGGAMAGTAGATIVSDILTIPARMNFLNAAIPAAPAAGGLSVFNRNLAGKQMMCAIGETGVNYPFQAALFDHNVAMWLPGTGTTAAIAFGTSWTVTATQAHPTIAATTFLTSMRRATFSTSTTSGNASGIMASTPVCMRGSVAGAGGFFYKCRFGFVTVQSAMQFMVGLTAQTTILAGEPNAIINSFVLGKLTGGTNMALFTYSGTTASTLITTGVAPAADAVYDLSFYCAPNGASITVRLVNIVTNTVIIDNVSYNTNLPATTAVLLPHCDIRTNAASAVSLAVSNIYVESDV